MDPMNPGDGGHDVPLTGAHIGKSVVIKGELSGSENLFVDGEVEGSIQLDGHSLTIGQNGRVRANLKAKDVVVQGRVDGNVTAGDRLDLRKTAIVTGDIQAQRIAVEDGAFLKGKIETTKAESVSASVNSGQPRPDSKQAAAMMSSGSVSSSGPVNGAQVPGTEPKR